jgi:hydrogenase maturation protease
VPVQTRPDTSRALVLGFGNILLSDDGAGIRLIERLRSDLGPSVAEFVDGGTLSFSLLHYIEATDSMLVIDAAAMDGFLNNRRRRTVHEVGLIDLLDMARLQDCLPPRRALLCIQPARIDWSETLSAPVAQALSEAARLAQALLQRWTIR